MTTGSSFLLTGGWGYSWLPKAACDSTFLSINLLTAQQLPSSQPALGRVSAVQVHETELKYRTIALSHNFFGYEQIKGTHPHSTLGSVHTAVTFLPVTCIIDKTTGHLHELFIKSSNFFEVKAMRVFYSVFWVTPGDA